VFEFISSNGLSDGVRPHENVADNLLLGQNVEMRNDSASLGHDQLELGSNLTVGTQTAQAAGEDDSYLPSVQAPGSSNDGLEKIYEGSDSTRRLSEKQSNVQTNNSSDGETIQNNVVLNVNSSGIGGLNASDATTWNKSATALDTGLNREPETITTAVASHVTQEEVHLSTSKLLTTSPPSGNEKHVGDSDNSVGGGGSNSDDSYRLVNRAKQQQNQVLEAHQPLAVQRQQSNFASFNKLVSGIAFPALFMNQDSY